MRLNEERVQNIEIFTNQHPSSKNSDRKQLFNKELKILSKEMSVRGIDHYEENDLTNYCKNSFSYTVDKNDSVNIGKYSHGDKQIITESNECGKYMRKINFFDEN